MSLSSKLLDGIGWKARGDFYPPQSDQRSSFFPSFKQGLYMIPMLIRLFIFCAREWWYGRGVFIDLFFQMKHNPFTGVPIGSIGSGSIGTDFRGAFNKFSIVPGMKEQFVENIKANQYIISVKNEDGRTVFQSLLSCADFKEPTLSTWTSMFDKTDMKYRGLFPRSWRQFHIEHLQLTVLSEQMSPVIPNDYEDSSLPLSLSQFTVLNDSNRQYSVSITFTFRNGTGNPKWQREGLCSSELFESNSCRGISLSHSVRGMPVTFALGLEKTDSVSTSYATFDPCLDGSEIWEKLQLDGKLNESASSYPQEEMGVAICSSFSVPPKCSEDTCFSLIWHMPEVSFGLKQRVYKRRYTRFFHPDTTIVELADRGFARRAAWGQAIDRWQNPVIEDSLLPEWYRSALFNELYYVVDGSTVWFEFNKEWLKDETEISGPTTAWMEKYGRFAYMESWEYYMFNTYDVHFYASWALLKNWPALEMGIQLDYCDQIYRIDNRQEMSMSEGKPMSVKTYGRVPHDMGHPLGEPFMETNAYLLHDTADWRDLNLKFVLLCWRDWKVVYDKMSPEDSRDLLRVFFDRSCAIVDSALTEWDIDGDGMAENSGRADQTYDMWTMTGTSAYCGSLWLCALWSLKEMAGELKEKKLNEHYSQLLKQATVAFVKKLWNGRYFKFDENPANDKTIMADQLCGVWFQYMMDKENPLIPDKMISSTLETLFDMNVMSCENGALGPVNGILEDGTVDVSSIQSEEVWTGTAYALASFFIAKGLREKGFATARGTFESCWNQFGLQWQTPEAIYTKKYYRAIGYMRPLAIWSMQEAIERQK